MLDEARELQAQAIARGIIERIEAAGGEEDRADTIRRVNEIRNPQVRTRVFTLIAEYHRRREGGQGPE
jgi:hypothetical protein